MVVNKELDQLVLKSHSGQTNPDPNQGSNLIKWHPMWPDMDKLMHLKNSQKVHENIAILSNLVRQQNLYHIVIDPEHIYRTYHAH